MSPAMVTVDKLLFFVFFTVYQLICISQQQQHHAMHSTHCRQLSDADDCDDDVSDGDSARTEDGRRSHVTQLVALQQQLPAAGHQQTTQSVTAGIQLPLSAAEPVVLSTQLPGQSASSSSQATLSDVPEATAAVKSIFNVTRCSSSLRFLHF